MKRLDFNKKSRKVKNYQKLQQNIYNNPKQLQRNNLLLMN